MTGIIFTVLCALILDRITKLICIKYLAGEASIPIIKGVLQLTYVRNTGAAFSMFSNSTRALAVFTAVVCVVLVFFMASQKKKNPGKRIYIMSLAMILGGALGNLYDRFAYGYVVDFVDFILINFAVFNVADIFITVGGAIFCCCLLFDKEIKL
ncbi:MAG: signal peptidase II [Eubacteriaceae bacterium]|nr:signal peptidase II [Eubacteriaceae bacterium]